MAEVLLHLLQCVAEEAEMEAVICTVHAWDVHGKLKDLLNEFIFKKRIFKFFISAIDCKSYFWTE
jgi:hypothetical protein